MATAGASLLPINAEFLTPSGTIQPYWWEFFSNLQAALAAIESPWTNYAASSTVVGWSAFTTKSILYAVLGTTVVVQYYLDGTSNSVTTTFTLPHANASAVSTDASIAIAVDNSVILTDNGRLSLAAAASIVNLYTSQAGAAWTNVGTKTVRGQFLYQIA